MGVNISDIIPKKEIEVGELKGKVVAIDAFNTLYQFLSSIRQMDGTPLQDKQGNVTSHLSGLFYRNINLLQEGVKLVYVFDGKSPELKKQEIQKRREQKIKAKAKFDEAKKVNDTDSMRKYASQFVKVTDQIIQESKELLEAMGIPVIQAPGEGEAESSYLAKKEKVWAAASQDYDALLYATPFLVRNLTLARRRKSSSGIYVDVKIELITFEDVLNKLDINLEQLICLAILVGTDYNPGGVRGMGQKRALEFVKRYEIPSEIFKAVEKSERYEIDFEWNEIFAQFYDYAHDSPNIEFKPFDEQRIIEILGNRDFSIERITSGIDKLRRCEEEKKQKALEEFF